MWINVIPDARIPRCSTYRKAYIRERELANSGRAQFASCCYGDVSSVYSARFSFPSFSFPLPFASSLLFFHSMRITSLLPRPFLLDLPPGFLARWGKMHLFRDNSGVFFLQHLSCCIIIKYDFNDIPKYLLSEKSVNTMDFSRSFVCTQILLLFLIIHEVYIIWEFLENMKFSVLEFFCTHRN